MPHSFLKLRLYQISDGKETIIHETYIPNLFQLPTDVSSSKYPEFLNQQSSKAPDQINEEKKAPDSPEKDSEEILQKEFNDVSNIKSRVSDIEEIGKGVESVKGMADHAVDVFDQIKIRVKPMKNEEEEEKEVSCQIIEEQIHKKHIEYEAKDWPQPGQREDLLQASINSLQKNA
uniref:DDE_Tnp_IS1595 domain-containing protein n=1 Tax=Caenorhabditis tropicalis TaxID=1561998 RepID=A0A1I7TP11_9PELO